MRSGPAGVDYPIWWEAHTVINTIICWLGFVIKLLFAVGNYFPLYKEPFAGSHVGTLREDQYSRRASHRHQSFDKSERES